ncbi:hypothetical protein [Vannielia litorea]|uniref:Uncharacterized protein n=1 Tax=Vannielia litorea TaxID=1217970 RepID=A0A1N6FIW7_9RHOB|nr:hypothetical protein [Vannielia litorea]SIN95177.1 hypothetical protein SAMN05444002_1704 [Vannielia litorea]
MKFVAFSAAVVGLALVFSGAAVAKTKVVVKEESGGYSAHLKDTKTGETKRVGGDAADVTYGSKKEARKAGKVAKNLEEQGSNVIDTGDPNCDSGLYNC